MPAASHLLLPNGTNECFALRGRRWRAIVASLLAALLLATASGLWAPQRARTGDPVSFWSPHGPLVADNQAPGRSDSWQRSSRFLDRDDGTTSDPPRVPHTPCPSHADPRQTLPTGQVTSASIPAIRSAASGITRARAPPRVRA